MDTKIASDMFCEVFQQFPVFWSKVKEKDSIIVEVSSSLGFTAVIDFRSDGLIVAMIDIPETNYFHAWEIMNNKQDMLHAAKKISTVLNDENLYTSNRILNATGIF